MNEKRKYSQERTRWSKLQTALYRVIAPEIKFQIHCCAYNVGQSLPIPRLWVTVGKDIVWDFPKDFVNAGDWYFDDAVRELTCLIRDYIDCPVEELLTCEFNDRFGLLPLLRVCDRRIGKRRLSALLVREEYSGYGSIMRMRTG